MLRISVLEFSGREKQHSAAIAASWDGDVNSPTMHRWTKTNAALRVACAELLLLLRASGS